MRIPIKQLLCLWLIVSQSMSSAVTVKAKCSSKQLHKLQSMASSKIGVMVVRQMAGEDQTFNPPVRLNEDSLIEIQPHSEFSRGLAEAMIERLQASSAFDVYDQEEESGEIPDGVDYVIKARVISIGLTTNHGNGRANKLCRFIKCSRAARDAIARVKWGGEQVIFTVKVAVTATEADSKRIFYAGSFTGKVTARGSFLSDDEGDFGAKALQSPAASNAAHQALDQAVAALARRLTAE